MIDIHSHILAGLDDGAATLEDSVAMVRMAAEAGTTDIVATPHSNLQYRFDPEVVERKIAELADAAGTAPRIHYGCDFHLSFDAIQDALQHPGRYAINHKSYLLVEFSELLIASSSSEIFDRMLAAGVAPVITHPERNWLLQQQVDGLRQWVEKGCLLQVTAQSLLGRFGSRALEFSEQLIEQGLVHVVASDAHDCEHRPPVLSEAFRHIARRYGNDEADRLFVRNPWAILEGEPIEKQGADEEAAVAGRKWYRFW